MSKLKTVLLLFASGVLALTAVEAAGTTAYRSLDDTAANREGPVILARRPSVSGVQNRQQQNQMQEQRALDPEKARERRCRKYARDAVNHHKDNLRHRCRFRGGRWQSNYKAHYDWCLRANGRDVAREDKARRTDLARCTGQGSSDAARMRSQLQQAQGKGKDCRGYATKAVAHHRDNLRHRCGFRGGRWHADHKRHYQWCARAAQRDIQKEQLTRLQGLLKCKQAGGRSGEMKAKPGRKTQEMNRESSGRTGACRTYARKAVDHHKDNLRFRCGFRGGRWHTDYKRHYQWCVGAAQRDVRKEELARLQGLLKCRRP